MKQPVFLILITLLLILSCNKKHKTNIYTDDKIVDQYISQRSNTYLKNGDEIHLTFSNTENGEENIGTVLPKSQAWIEPEVSGDFIWVSASKILFKPKERFLNGSIYSVSLKVKEILGLDSSKEDIIVIKYEVLPISFTHTSKGLSYESMDSKALSLSGSILSSDYMDIDAVKSMLSSSQESNNALQTLWQESNGFQHNYTIQNILRKDEESSLAIKWDARTIDSKFIGSTKVRVPAKGAYEVLGYNTYGDGNKKISLTFSDILDPNQNVDGLIRIKSYSAGFTYEINKNILNIYLKESLASPFELVLDKAIKNIERKTLAKDYVVQLSFDLATPELAAIRQGMIIPSEGKIIMPFNAKNLRYVDVEVFKLFQDNVLQFLQYNNLNDNINQRVVGRTVYTQKVDLLQLDNTPNVDKWVKYALDLNKYISADKGAVYQINIGYRIGYAANQLCDDVDTNINDGTYGLMDYGSDYSGYEYDQRDNPCHRSYYMSERFINQNILSSNVGLIVKGNEDEKNWTVITTNLREAGPLSGSTVELYDYQQQLITTSTVDNNGMVTIQAERNPSFIIAKNNGEFGYINLQDGYNNSLSEFDVSGNKKSNGLDGYIYGERGVWRPGDTMFLSFVLQNSDNNILTDHPIVFEIRDARSKMVFKGKSDRNSGPIYHKAILINSGAPTGNWSVKVIVGNSYFSKTLKVENIKPNKLKINYTNLFPEYTLSKEKTKLSFNAMWLHGATADGLKTEAEVQYKEQVTRFKNYGDYTFDDPARNSDFQTQKVLQGVLDNNGSTSYDLTIDESIKPKGKLRANIKTRVYEKSGNFSEDYVSVNVNPYTSYVGIKIPKSRWGSNFINSGEKTNVPIVVVDTDGKPISNRNLTIGLYAAEWNWWYNRSYNNMYEYSSANHLGAIEQSKLKTNKDGKANWTADLQGYGNYLVRICDTETGHCTGELFYTSEWGYPSNEVNSPRTFNFASDKTEYNVGEKVKVKIPSNPKSKILITVENSNNVTQSFWINGKKDETEISVSTDEGMSPNIYIHAMLIQPYDEHNNDLPLRMYGVLPVTIKNAKTILSPMIVAPSEIKPNFKYAIKVSELDGKSMSYTLAVVDEGLLDLTRFKTPNPHDQFFGKQALNTKTWDLYEFVASGYDKGIMNMFSIGGDGEGIAPGVQKANRFKPTVSYLGPFDLSKNGTNSHELEMSNYVGSVRVMVVGANEKSYGSSEKTVPVKQALMVTTTLPRVLAPGEEIEMGVNVFALDSKIRNVNIEVNPGGAAKSLGKQLSNISFDKTGDKLEKFRFTVPQKTGSATFNIVASSGNEKCNEQINIEIANPNVTEVKTMDFMVEKGSSKELDYLLHGVEGSNEVSLELYSVPPFKLGKRLQYLIRYPYGCLEQTTSSVFPQLYVNNISDVDKKQQQNIETNINAGIQKMARFQQVSGGFSYWPNNGKSDDWATSYAGDFLVEAKAKGYYVNSSMIGDWVKYQKKMASIWEQDKYAYNDLAQSYRLYTLAKSGNADLGSMNRIRTKKLKSTTAQYLLATAYAIIGQKDVAKQIVKNLSPEPEPYDNFGYTYGSELRDLGFIMEYYILIDDKINSVKLFREITSRLSKDEWYSTQTTAISLMSIGKFLLVSDAKGMKGSFQSNNGQSLDFNTNKTSFTRSISTLNNANQDQGLKVKNTSEGDLYGVLIISGKPAMGNEKVIQDRHISMDITYTNSENSLPIDITSLKQGTNFKAVITVNNLGTKSYSLDNLALEFTLPSGWEINNERMTGVSSGTSDNYTYCDVKDASVNYFFNLANRKSKTFIVDLTATYSGRFYKPSTRCSSMYDNEISSTKQGKWLNVLE